MMDFYTEDDHEEDDFVEVTAKAFWILITAMVLGVTLITALIWWVVSFP